MPFFNTNSTKQGSFAQLWIPEDLPADKKQIIQDLAEHWIKLEGALVELCLEHNVSLYLREEKMGALSLIFSEERARELYKEVGQWETSNESCNV